MSTQELHFFKDKTIQPEKFRAYIDKDFRIYLEKGLLGQAKVEEMTGLTSEEMAEGMKKGTFPKASVRLLVFFFEDEIIRYLESKNGN